MPEQVVKLDPHVLRRQLHGAINIVGEIAERIPHLDGGAIVIDPAYRINALRNQTGSQNMTRQFTLVGSVLEFVRSYQAFVGDGSGNEYADLLLETTNTTGSNITNAALAARQRDRGGITFSSFQSRKTTLYWNLAKFAASDQGSASWQQVQNAVQGKDLS
jgi:hypothetical protein